MLVAILFCDVPVELLRCFWWGQTHGGDSAVAACSGQPPDASETKSAAPEQATQRGDASTDAKPETQQQTQSQRQTQQQTQSHDHIDRGSPEHLAEKDMAEAAPETASAAAPQEPVLQSGTGQHAAAAVDEGALQQDVELSLVVMHVLDINHTTTALQQEDGLPFVKRISWL